jgi:hypothetical protein
VDDGGVPVAAELAARRLLDGLAFDGGSESPVGRWDDVVVWVGVTARADLMVVSYDRNDLAHASSRRPSPDVAWFRSGQWSGSGLTGFVDGVWPLDVMPSGDLLAMVAQRDDDRWWAEVVVVRDIGRPEPQRLLYERRRVRSVSSESQVWVPAGIVWDGPKVLNVAMDAASGVWAVLSGRDGCVLSRWDVAGGEPVSVPLPGGVEVLALTPLLDGMRVVARQHPDGRRYVLDLDLIGEVRRVIGLGGEWTCRQLVGAAVGADRVLLAGYDDGTPCLALAELRPADPQAGLALGAFPLGYQADPYPVGVRPPELRTVGAASSRLYLVDCLSDDDDGTFDSVHVIDLADP